MKRRLLTLSDLYNYYSSKAKNSRFSATNGENIVVQVEGKIKFDKSNNDTEGLLPVELQACHTLQNLNSSNINEDVMETALPSFSNRPILGFIHYVNDEPHFYGHNMHLDENDEIVYDEIPIGIIPESCEAHLEFDEEKGHNYVCVKGYIFKEYTKAAEIVQREEELSVSVELSIRELSYNAKDKYLDIEDFYFSGVTILGVNEDGDPVKPGMEGSNIKLADFAASNNSVFSNNDKLVETLEKLNDILSSFNINNNHGKEETEVEKDKELFEEEVVETVEEVVEAEVIEEETTEEITTEEVEEAEEVEETIEDSAEETPEEVVVINEVREIEVDKLVKSFEISHDDIRYGLYNLLSAYEQEDNEWYWITAVYDSHFVYENWSGDKIFGQKYTKEDDNVAFDGERYNLHKELLTDSEYIELQTMRENYALMQERLSSYESAALNAAKEAIFANEAYAKYIEKEEFTGLKNDMDKYSIEELTEKCELAFAKCARKFGFSLNENEKKKTSNKLSVPVGTFSVNESQGCYGGIFKDVK